MVYDGHKSVYTLKFQTLALPNGLIANMYGPVGEYANEIPSIIPSMNSRLAEGTASTPSCMEFCIIFNEFSVK